jgi:RNA polymerase sigma-70 factor (sigma-E family)
MQPGGRAGAFMGWSCLGQGDAVRERDSEYVGFVTQRLPSLRRLAFLLTQDWHRADDVVQTAVTQLYLHWRRVSDVDNLDAYARTVLVRSFLGERRRWGSRVNLVPAMPDAPAEQADHAGRLALRAALAAVPPRQRATLVLRFYCDLSVEQVADALGCSEGTVKSQTARGLEALRRVLATERSTP